MKRFEIAPAFCVFSAVSALVIVCPALLSAQTETGQRPETKTAELPWLDDLSAAYREAALKQRPIFVRVGGAGCGWCVKLEKEIAAPEVQAELKRWTLVYLDLDRHPAEVRRLAVGPIPALRVMTHTGRVVQASDGYREAADLVKWLQPQFTTAMSAPDAALLSSGPPNLAETLRLVRVFGDRDPLLREAAIRRLLPHPDVAREDVVSALKEGSLAAKLSALELLSEWKAPVQGIDPWRPETLAAEKFKPLDDWLQVELPASATAAAKELYEKEVKSLKNDLAQLVTTDEASATALRERIARIGDVAIPYVHEALAAAATDREHERLLALRYRLVSPADLTLRWPGGLERLSSRDVNLRHQAADELAQFSLPELQPLLLELFSDPDPLVRELALRGLRQLGGKRATTALVKLLSDPEPNVRAAVLKQITEDAQADMLTQVGEYVAREKDADLVVHAVRYLREVKQPESVAYMLPLLDHSSWQVRAEAAEGIGKILEESRRYASGGAPAPPAVLEKLRALLGDPDPFVVSRAAKALPRQYTEKTVDALLRVAEAQPTLAREIIEQVASYSADQSVAFPKLLPFLENSRHEVRAAAIRHVIDLQDKETEPRLIRALDDKEAEVRKAAADAFVDQLQKLRPDEDSELSSSFLLGKKSSIPADEPATEDKKSQEESPQDQWLRALYGGKHRPKWTAALLPPLQKMVGSNDPHERAIAARALIPLGQIDAAWPVLLAAAPQHAEAFATALDAQKWLLADKRLEMFRELARLAKDEDQLSSLIGTASSSHDLRIADEIWKLLDRPNLSSELSSSAQYAFKPMYLGSRYWDLSEVSDKIKVKAATAFEPHAHAGSSLKRLVAINLLLSVAPAQASKIAETLLKDEEAPADLRRDAFQIFLLTLDGAEREKRAIAVLTEGNKDRSLTALRLLILGPQSLAELPATKFTLDLSGSILSHGLEIRGNGPAPIIPQPPKQLTAEQIRPLTEDADEQVAAYAGYLLALLDEPAGLKPLLAYWNRAKPDAAHDRLVYRAIAVGDDAAYLGQLRTIYSRLTDDDDKGEFYWTIRIMSGDEVLAFRDQIRKEVGIEKLKNTQSRFSY